MDKIKKDHASKSEQLRRAKKKLKLKTKTTVNVKQLEDKLKRLKKQPVNPKDYYTPGVYYGSDDAEYLREIASWDARIELLEQLINEIKERR